MMRGALSASAVAVCFLAGCGAADDGPQSPARGGADATKVVRTYQQWTVASCAAGARCGDVFVEKAGVSPGWNPKPAMENPDPEWLVGWEKLPTSPAQSHVVMSALALAASERSFSQACDAAYGEYDKKLSRRIADLTSIITKEARDPNPYDRLSALLALVPASDPTTPGEMIEGSDPARYQIEAELFDAFEATNHTFLYAVNGYAPSPAILSSMHKREPRAYEHDAFCLAAMRGQMAGVAPLPDSLDAGEARDFVKPIFTPNRIAEIETRKKQLVDVTRAKFAKVTGETPALPPGVRKMNEGKVARFERNGQQATVVLVIVGESTDASGKVQKVDENITATFAEWPSGIVLDVGDAISFYGIERKVKDTIIESSPKLQHLTRETQVDGKHVYRLLHKGKAVSFWAQKK